MFFTPEFVSNTFLSSTDNLDKESDSVIYGLFNVVAAQSILSRKIVAAGDSNTFSDGDTVPAGNYIDAADNEQLLKNIINW